MLYWRVGVCVMKGKDVIKNVELTDPEGTRNLPTDEILLSVKQGDFVKVVYGGERFWVKVIVAHNKISGRVDSRLVNPENNLKYGDIIKFDRDKIVEIYNERIF